MQHLELPSKLAISRSNQTAQQEKTFKGELDVQLSPTELDI
ncbi:hypothetical protein S7335_802 [Synechococcus sp. PCC 7335]|nr:hypothetical protein S7335_802 [Synechococcus sp. PCC 7335]